MRFSSTCPQAKQIFFFKKSTIDNSVTHCFVLNYLNHAKIAKNVHKQCLCACELCQVWIRDRWLYSHYLCLFNRSEVEVVWDCDKCVPISPPSLPIFVSLFLSTQRSSTTQYLHVLNIACNISVILNKMQCKYFQFRVEHWLN